MKLALALILIELQRLHPLSNTASSLRQAALSKMTDLKYDESLAIKGRPIRRESLNLLVLLVNWQLNARDDEGHTQKSSQIKLVMINDEESCPTNEMSLNNKGKCLIRWHLGEINVALFL